MAYVAEQLSNGAQTTLSAAITTGGQTNISVSSYSAFPTGAGQFRILIDSEIMLVTAGQGTTTWTVTRAVESFAGAQVATTHASGATVTSVLTAGAVLAITLPRIHASAAQTTAQNDSSSTPVTLSLDAITYDPLGLFNTSTHAFACPIAGIYLVTASFSEANWTAGDRLLMLYRNGSEYRELARSYSSSGGSGNWHVAGGTTISCAANDSLVLVYETPGATANSVTGGAADFVFVGAL